MLLGVGNRIGYDSRVADRNVERVIEMCRNGQEGFAQAAVAV